MNKTNHLVVELLLAIGALSACGSPAPGSSDPVSRSAEAHVEAELNPEPALMLRGSESQNGGYGIRIGSRAYSLDLALRGVQDQPYTSETVTNALTENELAMLKTALAPVADEEALRIVIAKLSELRKRIHELKIPYSVRHLAETAASFSWVSLPSLDCLDVLDDSTPLPNKFQVAYRERIWIRLCKGFASLDAANRAALLLHEIIYASLKSKSVTLEMVGFLFSPQFKAFNAPSAAEFAYLMDRLTLDSQPFSPDFFFVRDPMPIEEKLDPKQELCFGYSGDSGKTYFLWKRNEDDKCAVGEQYRSGKAIFSAERTGQLKLDGESYPVGKLSSEGTKLVDLCSGVFEGLCHVEREPELKLNLLLPPSADPDSIVAALESGSSERLDYLVRNRIGLDTSNSGRTPITYAIQQKRLDLLERLLDAGANPSLSAQDKAPIVLAALEFPAAIETLLKHGANPNVMIPGKGPLIAYAVTQDNLELVKRLVAQGATLDVEGDGDFRRIPLLVIAFDRAILTGRKEIVRALIEGGANLNKPFGEYSSDKRRHPFFMAIEMDDAELVALMIRKGASPNQEFDGKQALFFAIERGKNRALASLLDGGAKLERKDYHDPLVSALVSKNSGAISLMIRHGLDLTVTTDTGSSYGTSYSILGFAIQVADLTCFRVLHETGLEFSKRESPLHEAVASNQVEIALYLIQTMRMPIDIEYSADGTALNYAVERGSLSFVKFLVEMGANPNISSPLVKAVRKKNLPILEALLQAPKINLEQTGYVDEFRHGTGTALMTAVVEKSPILLKRLCQAGARADTFIAKDEYSTFTTALSLSILNMSQEMFEILMNCGASPNFPKDDSPALAAAAATDSIEIAKRLLAKGANPNRGKFLREPPLNYAIQSNNPEMVDLLLRYKADPNQEGYGWDRKPLRLAKKLGNSRIIEALIQAGAKE